MSGGMVFSAPRKMIIVKAVPRHTFAMITDGIGKEPSQSTGATPIALRKTWFSDPKKKSNIADQRYPAMRVGFTHASSTAAYASVAKRQPRRSA